MAVYFRNQEVNINGPTVLREITMRPDAELIQTYTKDSLYVTDDGNTLPAYADITTTAQTLKAAEDLSPTITVDFNNYNYLISQRILTIPIYNITSIAKGREEYQFATGTYEIVNMPANSFKTLVNGKLLASANVTIPSRSFYRLLYWSSASAISLYSSQTYGMMQNLTAPAVSGTTLTCRTPVFYTRVNATYLSSTYYQAITDVRLQYIIEVYRAPKNHLNIDGWDAYAQANKIITCVNSNSLTLT